MRVKYSFTTDLKDVPSGVHFHLSKYLGKRSVDNNLKRLMDLMRRDELNFSLISKDINKLREQLGKLDMLLSEASIILSACEGYEKGPEFQPPPVEEEVPESAPEVRAEQPAPAPTEQLANQQKYQKIEQNLSQMNEITQTLNHMRKSKPWEFLEQEGNNE
tara:strand:- start:455 stop:937 length:483 start_codon:yes stop_codon:yes gene_type:complete